MGDLFSMADLSRFTSDQESARDKFHSKHSSVYRDWEEHNSCKELNTAQSVFNMIRCAYPTHVVVSMSAKQCDLLGYAENGHARVTIDDDGPGFSAQRVFTTSDRDIKADHELKYRIHFAKYNYEWRGSSFIVYEGRDNDRYGPKKFQFVLHEKTYETNQEIVKNKPTKTKSGHCDWQDDTIDALLMEVCQWTHQAHDEVWVFNSEVWFKSRRLWENVKEVTWDDVTMDPAMKKSLMGDIEGFFNNKELYDSLNIPWKRGIILHGVPGNGKTITLKAVTNSLMRRDPPVGSLYVKSLDGCHGLKYSLDSIFEKARLMSPCMLIFEDLDSLVTDEVRSYFLNEVDGFVDNDGILMVGSTNHLGQLDASITKRPSRFDRKYHFKLPETPEREAYVRTWQQKLSHSKSVDFPEEICALVAEMTPKFSYAYIKELLISSLLLLARDEYCELNDDDAMSFDSDAMIEGCEPEENGPKEEKPKVDSENGAKDEVAGGGEEKGTENGDKSDAKKKSKPKYIDVKIPEHVEGNALLRFIKSQAKVLFNEMNSSDDDGDEEGKTRKRKKLMKEIQDLDDN